MPNSNNYVFEALPADQPCAIFCNGARGFFNQVCAVVGPAGLWLAPPVTTPAALCVALTETEAMPTHWLHVSAAQLGLRAMWPGSLL